MQQKAILRGIFIRTNAYIKKRGTILNKKSNVMPQGTRKKLNPKLEEGNQ